MVAGSLSSSTMRVGFVPSTAALRPGLVHPARQHLRATSQRRALHPQPLLVPAPWAGHHRPALSTARALWTPTTTPLRMTSTSSDSATASPTATSTIPKSDDETTATTPGGKNDNTCLTLLFDGECPLCVKEVNMLRRRSDARGGTLAFVDIADDTYDEARFGIDYATAMGRIHAVRARDGAVIEGVQVFREAYEAVGLGWVYAVLRVPGAGAVAEWVYGLWADRRMELTGRGSLEAVIRAKEEKRSCR